MTARTFVLPGVSGETVRLPPRLSGNKRLSVIVFWATWNRFCALELERLAKLWPKWSGSGVSIVAVNVEASRIGAGELATIESWLARRQLPFPVALDRGLLAFRAYGVVAVPTTVVVDADRRIVMRLAGFPIAGAERLIRLVEQRLIEEKAAKQTSRAVSLTHRMAVRHLRLARLLRRKSETDLAEYTLKKAIEEDPSLLEARTELVHLYHALGKEDRASRILAEAAAEFPESSALLLERAEAEFRRGSHQVAEAMAQKAFRRNPALAPGLTLIGRIRLASKDLGAALRAFRQAAGLNPLDPEPLLQAGAVLEAQGQKEEALACYEQAYDLLNTTTTRARTRVHEKKSQSR
ncbi:MAG: redoxin domain-containing protein [Planctomycetota bacterium]